MKKLINNPNNVVEDMIEGYLNAHSDYVKMIEGESRALITSRETTKNKVGIVIGGGSGHEPAFLGYVGDGMADGVAIGNIFASPPPGPIQAVTKAVDKGAGVLYIYGNYTGDIMNFSMAAEFSELEDDIEVESVVVTDDVASAPKEEKEKRRGIAGSFLVNKVASAYAAMGYDLQEVSRVARKTNEQMRSMGVGLTPCYLPQTGKPSFEISEDEMEIGLGHHGEPGVEKGKLESADKVTERLVNDILIDMPIENGQDVVVLVNGLGSTPAMELYTVFNKTKHMLDKIGVNIYHSYIGDYVTSFEMGGCSITLLVVDDELKRGIDYPVDCPMFVQKGRA